MPKLDIIIPRYQEPQSIINILLQSISIQTGIDFSSISVIIVEDGSKERFSADFINQFKFPVSILHLDENKGVSNARNVGLFNATSDYVMFCDADDSFHTTTAIATILQNCAAAPVDIYTYAFLSEGKNAEGKYTYSPVTNNNTFVHGKVYRRQFLMDNQIFFNPALKVHEDGYFNILANSYTKNQKVLGDIIYMWRHNAASVTRQDPAFLAKTLKNFVISSIALTMKLESKPEPDITFITNSVIHNILYLYVQTQLPYWKGQDDHKKLCEQFIAYYVQHFHKYYDAATDQLKQAYWINEITSGLKQGYPTTAENFPSWLERMKTIEVK